MISRRKFLRGSSAAALVLLKPELASAWSHGSAPSGSPVTGKALINDGSSDQSYMFANVLKTANTFAPLATVNYAWQAYLDSNGYPNNAPGNQLSDNIQYLVSLPPAWGTTPLVVSWKGTGAFYLQPAAVSNYSVTAGTSVVDTSSLPTFIKVTGTNVRIVFNFTSAPVSPQVAPYIGYFLTTTTYSGFNSLIFCRQSDETAVNANQNALNPDYVAMLKTLNPRTFRGLDISGVNGGQQSRFSQRAPAGAFSFFADRYPPEDWAGTAAGTNVYTCSAPSGWGGLVDGATVIVQFTNANTLTGTSVTLNVASTGAAQITDLGPVAMTAGEISAGSIWTLTYSLVYGYWTGRTTSTQADGGVTSVAGGLTTRVPLEQHIAIANAANCNLWYNICHRIQASDGASIAAVVLSNLNSQLAFYPELSNEVWNAQFTQTSFIENLGLTMGFTPANVQGLMSGYGLLARMMMGAITTAWGGPNSRLRRVMAFQAFGDNGASGSNNLYRFKGNQLAPSGTGTGAGNSIYNSFTGSANYTTSPNRPIDFSDVMAYATYYSGGESLQFQQNYIDAHTAGLNFNNLTTAADEYAAGGSGITTALAWFDNDIRQGLKSDGSAGSQTMLDLSTNIYPAWETIAASYDSGRPSGTIALTIECYEGAMAVDVPSASTCTAIGISTSYATTIQNLLFGYKNTAAFSTLVQNQFAQFLASGAHAKTPAWYQIVGFGGPWALTPGDLYTLPPAGSGQYQSWNGTVAFN